MTRKELYEQRKEYIFKRKYVCTYWKNYNYKILQNIMYVKRPGRGNNPTYDDCIIMFDTETSKKSKYDVGHNHVVAFTISIRAFDTNIVTLYGNRPDDCISCIIKIMENLQGEKTVMYAHNLAYDYVFLRLFLMQRFGKPVKQLAIKSHYPIRIEYANGLILKDSLVLSQCKLEKWAKDLNVEHKKAVGKWDYNKIRHQHEKFSADEIEYIEHDTLAGVECIAAVMKKLGKRIYSMPYTATGIVREDCRKEGIPFHAHEEFMKISPEFETYLILEKVFHGGFTHANRHIIGETLFDMRCYDFTSSYPFCMLAFKYPMHKFAKFHDCSMDDILQNEEKYAYMCKLILFKFKLHDPFDSMPVLQYSKAENMINCVTDNGRITAGAYMEIYCTEQDIAIIKEHYDIEKHICTEVYFSEKDYLPRWFTDFVFKLFEDKVMKKGGDPVDYLLSKARVNCCYGMTVQKAIQDIIEECYTIDECEDGKYEPGMYKTKSNYTKDTYIKKYIKNHNKILPYQWGCWVTAYAMRNLFKLFKCIKQGDEKILNYPAYCDTDSCYAHEWDMEKLEEYNQRCKDLLTKNGYGPVIRDGKEHWLGVAVSEGEKDHYHEFRTLGAKRYCGRKIYCDNEGYHNDLYITVAGVPKKGSKCLNDNIENFHKGFIFPGVDTGKLTHKYFFVDSVYTDDKGNLTGDSIDLSPCDYKLDDITIYDFEKIYEEEIEVVCYEEENDTRFLLPF